MRLFETFTSVYLMVGRGRYRYCEPVRPMDVVLLQEYLEPMEVYEKRPPRRRAAGNQRARCLTRCGCVSMPYSAASIQAHSCTSELVYIGTLESTSVQSVSR